MTALKTKDSKLWSKTISGRDDNILTDYQRIKEKYAEIYKIDPKKELDLAEKFVDELLERYDSQEQIFMVINLVNTVLDYRLKERVIPTSENNRWNKKTNVVRKASVASEFG